jgi:hypothetical protein
LPRDAENKILKNSIARMITSRRNRRGASGHFFGRNGESLFPEHFDRFHAPPALFAATFVWIESELGH